MNSKQLLVVGAFLGGLGVALGAVGSHALKELLVQNGRTETFETAVRYQVYHSLALLIVGILAHSFKGHKLEYVGYLFLAGVILFSGSLFALSLTSFKWVVYATPLGGMMMIGGWLLLLVRLVNLKA